MRSPLTIPLTLSILVITCIGLYSKVYRGWVQAWVNNSSGGIFYVVFWCLLFFAICPSHKNIRWIPVGVFVATCLLEILQLWQPPFLQAMRSTLLGRLILGTTFVWDDFVYYAIGALVGWLWLRVIWDRTHIH